jgi:probable phosphoglycerate mutase
VTGLILVRHGHVEGIAPERFRGRRDLPLTRRGEAEAEAVARRIARSCKPACIYTSPLMRCVATGAAIARACGVSSAVLPALNDIDYGAYEFKSHDDVRGSDPALFAAWLATPHLVRFPNGESLQDLAARAADALRTIVARHPGETVVAVAHDSVNRALLLLCLDMPLSLYWRIAQAPCCIDEIDIAEGRITVRRINDTAHLEETGGA